MTFQDISTLKLQLDTTMDVWFSIAINIYTHRTIIVLIWGLIVHLFNISKIINNVFGVSSIIVRVFRIICSTF